jgi:hypothetical protein
LIIFTLVFPFLLVVIPIVVVIFITAGVIRYGFGNGGEVLGLRILLGGIVVVWLLVRRLTGFVDGLFRSLNQRGRSI